MSIDCQLVSDPMDGEREAVNAILREHNQRSNPGFWSARDDAANQALPVSVLARDQSRRIVGGLFGETQFSWLKINIVSVHPEFRRQGIGTRIMRVAETEAVRRGCRYSFLDTMEFQGPDFYVRCGYTIVGSIPDWDSHGHAKIFMTKQI